MSLEGFRLEPVSIPAELILPDGTIVVGLIDNDGTLRTSLRLSANGATGLSVHTGEGKAASLISEPDNGKVHLRSHRQKLECPCFLGHRGRRITELNPTGRKRECHLEFAVEV